MQLRSHRSSAYCLRDRKQDLSSVWTETDENDLDLEINELLQHLHELSHGKFVVLNDKMRAFVSSHLYKHSLLACSVPVPNESDLEMKSLDSEDATRPDFVVHMVWGNKDGVITEDANVCINEFYEICKPLLKMLTKLIQNEPYLDAYLQYIVQDASEFVEEFFECNIVGQILEMTDDAVRGVPEQFEYVVVRDVEGTGISNALMDGLIIKVDHIDAETLKNEGSLEAAAQRARQHGVYGGLISVMQVNEVVTNGTSQKETSLQFGLQLWKKLALSTRSTLDFFVVGDAFYGPNALKKKVEEAGKQWETKKFKRQGTQF